MNTQVRIFVENTMERRFLEGFLADELAEKRIQIDEFLLSSAALAAAKRSLLEQPTQPIALVLNANSTDPVVIEERLGSIYRILGQVASEGWHVTMVSPRMDEWAVVDNRVKEAFDREPSRLGPGHYVDRAVEFSKLVGEEPFDRQALLNKSDAFRLLCDFIKEHSTAVELTHSP